MSLNGYGEAAPEYRRRGHKGVLPLPNARKRHPPKGFTGRTGKFPDDAQIAQWCVLFATGNICLRPEHGVIGIDVDLYKDRDAYAQLEELAGEQLPDTWCSSARTDGSGIYWFRVPIEITRWKDAPVESVECVHFGHRYGIVYPSIHPELDAQYRWYHPSIGRADDDTIPSPDDFAELPAAYVELLRADRKANGARKGRVGRLRAVGGEPDDARRHLANVVVKLSEMAPESGRNNRLNESAFDLGKNAVATGRLTEADVEEALYGASEANGLVGDDGERPVRATIRSGLDAGTAAYAGDTGNTAPDGHSLTDTGNAARLVDVAGDRIRYVLGWSKWLVWRDKGVWEVDPAGALVRERAKAVAVEIYELAKAAGKDTKKGGELWAWAKQSKSAARIRAMVDLAAGIDSILIDHEQLDANPEILNVLNGTVDLRTGELRAHDPSDLCTLQANATFVPEARSELWERCLREWQPDEEIRTYLQLEAGAGLTGRATETLSVHYGSGGNGKSKYHLALQHALGGYAVQPDKSLLVTQKGTQHDTVKAVLFRKRYAVAFETSNTARLNEDQVKQLTGGDRISARRMREDPWEFWPTHTLMMGTNHKPRVAGRDASIWRRLRLIPWTVRIPDAEQDDTLADKLKLDAEAVLAWAVEGAQRFLRDGFTAPAHVLLASKEYRHEQDTVARFLDEEMEFGPPRTHKIGSKVLTVRCEEWAEARGVWPTPKRSELAEELERRGAVLQRTERGATWFGVQPRPNQGKLVENS